MPAVQLARLKAQIEWLAGFFTQPDQFTRELRQFFEAYADWTYRPGQDARDPIQTEAFHVPPLVMRQLDLSFAPLCRENPSAALELVDRLWVELYLEAALFAACLLGNIPPSHHRAVMDRIEAWALPEGERIITDSLLADGGRQLRKANPEIWMSTTGSWIRDEQAAYRSIGLRALLLLVEEPEFENLPAVYAMIGPLFQSGISGLQHEMTKLVQSLARRSPTETAYFLRQVVSISDDPLVARLARRCLPLLTPVGQAGLRSALAGRRSLP